MNGSLVFHQVNGAHVLLHLVPVKCKYCHIIQSLSKTGLTIHPSSDPWLSYSSPSRLSSVSCSTLMFCAAVSAQCSHAWQSKCKWFWGQPNVVKWFTGHSDNRMCSDVLLFMCKSRINISWCLDYQINRPRLDKWLT